MKQLESAEQYHSLAKDGKVIMLFTADWCGDCRFLEPFLPEIEATFPEYTFVSIDRDKYIDLCQEQDVLGIPSFIAYENGKEIGRFVSRDRKTKEEVIQFIRNLPASS
ncbi:thioredoxin-like protein YtpP [Compostibacillus humi]|uniref:Thioredoxin-like protein YtpP n=1 Tax=Compostibacillus humi TaxID=1245525 RepID=A0A8J2TNW5_9BACI|nr:thioredoxin family protein [Compostibacillus humi]GFZ82474.1 thioredoxin-like protein YtpP [Compostibacillus humi]HLT57081.1 thioredoxin family protein [Bacillota bacterium]